MPILNRLLPIAFYGTLCLSSQAQLVTDKLANKAAVFTALAVAYPDALALNTAQTNQAKLENLAKVNAWAAMPVPSVLPDIDQGELVRMLDVLHPNVQQRFARSYSFQEEISQQPDQIQLADGSFQNTPQKVLQKWSVTFTGAQMFPGSDEVEQEVRTWTEAGGKLTSDVQHGYCKPLLGIDKIAHCLLRDRTRDRFGRFGSGLVATFSYSENNRLRNGVNIPFGSAAAFANNQISGSLLYDPSRLLHTGTDWKNAQAAAAKYDEIKTGSAAGSKSVSAEIARLAKERCRTQELEPVCISRLAGLTGAGRLWPLLFPQLTFKEQTQFDFAKYGNAYVPYSGIQPSLFTLTLSWDLGKTIASATARRDAFVAIAALRKPPTKPASSARADIQKEFVLGTLNEEKFADQAWVDAFFVKLANVAASEGLTAAVIRAGQQKHD